MRILIITLLILCPGVCAQQQNVKPPKNMVLIPAGEFVMGTPASEIERLKALYNVKRDELFASEVPAHRVRLSAFYMDRYEVTNKDFAKFLAKNKDWLPGKIAASFDNGKYLDGWTDGKYPKGLADLPVTNVNWYAAQSFCHWTGKRLPTEAEWEYASRGGLIGAEFPWGNQPADPKFANYGKSGIGKPVRVGSYPANRFGLYDMAGNVWEFTADEWGSYSAADSVNPHAGPIVLEMKDYELINTRRVIRGGSFAGSPINMRVAYRDSHPANGSQPFVGFRCVKQL